MKLAYRVLPCLALNEMQALYMVQARLRGHWINVREGLNACLFRSPLEANIFIDLCKLSDATS